MSITRGVERYKFQLRSSFQQGVIYIGVCKEILSKSVGYSPCLSSRRERKRGREGGKEEGGRESKRNQLSPPRRVLQRIPGPSHGGSQCGRR